MEEADAGRGQQQQAEDDVVHRSELHLHYCRHGDASLAHRCSQNRRRKPAKTTIADEFPLETSHRYIDTSPGQQRTTSLETCCLLAPQGTSTGSCGGHGGPALLSHLGAALTLPSGC